MCSIYVTCEILLIISRLIHYFFVFTLKNLNKTILIMINKQTKLGIQDIAKELKKLEQYRKKGFITNDEFNEKIKYLLSN